MSPLAQQRIAILVLISVCGSAFWWRLTVSAADANSVLTVQYLDVGQGDATLIEAPNGLQILVDGGKDGSVLRGLTRALGFWDRDIDVVIATHPDSDHVGGLIDVLQRYEVDTIVTTDNAHDTPVATVFAELVARETEVVYRAERGQRIILGAESYLEILFPDRSVAALESNTASIIFIVRHGETQFMFTADAPVSIEEVLVDGYGSHLESDVLKVGHHGSKTSTAERFLEMVDPEHAVISAGCDNRYGHPHTEVIERLDDITVHTTCADGTVTFVSDGTQVWQK